ncbi:MAG: 1-acyl-sn-glycerol-3-phosphate acyltransferase [Treponema sp.]|jgi:1-acyl-sn-glycerol-3-phosphate acyltransferase|nr:1-acyl-sn-glycerol-3-phosphate acyltransferase [Treponema sp.]
MYNGDPDPITNWPLYICRVFVKWICYLLFGVSSLVLVIVVFPIMSLLFHPKERFSRYVRRFISGSFRWYFIQFMALFQVVKVDVEDRKAFRNLSSKIVVCNHPSHLDVVMMISLIPNADVIVRGSLTRNFFLQGVVNRLYILSSLDFEVLANSCIESLNRENCLVVFPQGTRTPRSGEIKLKKGAARIALMSGKKIVPVYIGGNDKWGLGKHDPIFAFNHTDKYIYRIRMQEEIDPEKYADLSMPLAVRRLNEEIRKIFLNPSNK